MILAALLLQSLPVSGLTPQWIVDHTQRNGVAHIPGGVYASALHVPWPMTVLAEPTSASFSTVTLAGVGGHFERTTISNLVSRSPMTSTGVGQVRLFDCASGDVRARDAEYLELVRCNVGTLTSSCELDAPNAVVLSLDTGFARVIGFTSATHAFYVNGNLGSQVECDGGAWAMANDLALEPLELGGSLTLRHDLPGPGRVLVAYVSLGTEVPVHDGVSAAPWCLRQPLFSRGFATGGAPGVVSLGLVPVDSALLGSELAVQARGRRYVTRPAVGLVRP